MNLTKLFNFNYLKQNLKKSKAVLLIFILLIPILNTLALVSTTINDDGFIPSLTDLSMVNIIGMYFLPIIISICLFNYLFKKKSVDFVNSMPINRKSIFITNTIGGILLIILMLITNTLLIFIISLIFNISITISMLLDYFIIWLTIYTFVFTASNLSNVVSGNTITSIIITLLLIFFIPFLSSYTSLLKEDSTNYDYYIEIKDDTITNDYICSKSDIDCTINKELNRYNININEEKNMNYNPLFDFIFKDLYGYYNQNTLSFSLKLVILSIIYIIFGYILFQKRKMEVSETSFKNIHIHNIIKSLTLLPFMAVSYIICRDSSYIAMIFVIIVMLIYYFIYDLITKKSITNIKYLLFYFTLSVCIYSIIFSCFGIEKDNTKVLEYNSIKSVAVNFSNYGITTLNNDTSSRVFINNKELLNLLMHSTLSYNQGNNYIRYYIKIGNKIYSLDTSLSEDDYNKVLNILYNNKEYIKEYKDIDFDNVYAIKLGRKIYNKNESKDMVKLIKNTLNNMTLEEFINLQNKYKYTSNNSYDIKLYSYAKNEQKIYKLSGYINYDLLNSVVNSNNNLLKENMKNIIPRNYYIEYSNKYFNEEYDISYNLINLASEELYSYILKEVNNNVDMKKEFVSLNLCLDNNCYDFTSNNIVDFKEILESKRSSLDLSQDDYIGVTDEY